jgi:hypothetical protein
MTNAFIHAVYWGRCIENSDLIASSLSFVLSVEMSASKAFMPL